MKKFMCVIIVVCFMFTFMGCGHDKTINGKHYETKGLFTLDERDPNIKYEVSFGNVVWSILLIETVIFPVYFIGWSILNPVCEK